MKYVFAFASVYFIFIYEKLLGFTEISWIEMLYVPLLFVVLTHLTWSFVAFCYVFIIMPMTKKEKQNKDRYDY